MPANPTTPDQDRMAEARAAWEAIELQPSIGTAQAQWAEKYGQALLNALPVEDMQAENERLREALNKAETALRGGHAIIVNELPHAPWLRTMDEAIEAASAALAASIGKP